MMVEKNRKGVKIHEQMIPKIYCPICGQSGIVLTRAEASAKEHFDVFDTTDYIDPMVEDPLGVRLFALCFNCKVTLQMSMTPNRNLISERMLEDDTVGAGGMKMS